MNTPADYIAWVQTLIALSSVVVGHRIIRETVEDTVAVYRYRLTLLGSSILEVSERVAQRGTGVVVTKYSFHWQDSSGNLIARWDTAPHHLSLPTFPHHIHDGGEANIQPHAQVSIADVLAEIAQRLSKKK